MSRAWRLPIILLLAGTLSGCIVWVDDLDDLQAFVQTARAVPAGGIEPLPEYKPYQSFVYKGASLREPFRALRLEQETAPRALELAQENNLAPDLQRHKAYLESFSLDDLRMVGSIRVANQAAYWALVRDTHQAVHRVKVGDFMGLDYGEVTAIDDGQIKLQEIISNGRGGWVKRSRTLALDKRAQ